MPLTEALAVQALPTAGTFRAEVHDGYDVFGIPHGGYLAALGANAVLAASQAPDIFTITTHYLRKAQLGPMDFVVQRVGGSRRFTTWTAVAQQDGTPVLSIMASTGDRTTIDGPDWSAWSFEPIDESALSPPAQHDTAFQAPAIAHRAKLRLDKTTIAFAEGRRTERAQLRAMANLQPVDQLAAILASDVTAPAIWNALGMKGWVPTVELTCHVRGRPVDGPLTVHVESQHASAGFLDEDAWVYDQAGKLIVQSRQLARWTAT